ncbi:MAG: peptide ABC transporter substrate-binding protein, partial [Candidatus Eremiobacteraeota bacterium]|nr:peptide ABC transporter substrate-binding protein [Candidatus Eremiobacteraeota bacterium]
MIRRPLFALALAALTLTACTKTAGTAGSGPNPWTQHGTVRVGNSDEPDNLNPMFAHTDASDQVAGLIYSNLLRYDDNGNFITDLATEIPTYENGGISKDGKTITFHLRKGAKWSDGAPLTAKDALFTFHAVNNPANNTKARFGWDDITSEETPDDYTLIVHLKQVNGGILGLFAFGGSAYPPLPAHLLAQLPDINRAPFNAAPISSGPFVLKRWTHGASLEFDANPLYFRGKPKLDHILWKVVPDGNTLFNQLKTHEIDVLSGVNENQIPELQNIPGINVTKKLIANWRHLGINTSKAALSDPRVRLALVESVDWKRINDTIYHGFNQLATSDIFPNSWAAPNVPPYPYDPVGAKKLLAEAGWTMGPDGVLHKGNLAMHLVISTGTNKQENQQAEVQIQNQLRPAGFDLAIRNYPVSLLFAQDGPIYTGKSDLEWSV